MFIGCHKCTSLVKDSVTQQAMGGWNTGEPSVPFTKFHHEPTTALKKKMSLKIIP